MDGLTDERLSDSHRIRGPCQLSHLSNMLGEISWKPFAKGKTNKCVYFFLLANGFWLLFVKMREKLPRIRWHCLSTGAVGTQNQRRVLNDFIWFYSTLFIFIALFVVCVVRCSFNRLSICNTRRRLSSLWMTLFVALCGPFESICEKKGFDPPLLVPTECIFWLALDTRGPFNTVIKNSVTHYLQV